jgi:hypothetical protein
LGIVVSWIEICAIASELEPSLPPNPFEWAQEKFIMEVINTLDTLVSPIDWLIPQVQALRKTITSDQMKRRVRAILLFLSVLVVLFLVGTVKTIQISLQVAIQEFESALQAPASAEISNSQENEGVAALEISNSQKMDDLGPPSSIAIVRDTRIRSLRKEASQQGIRNVSRMSKAELLVALQIPIESK